MVVRVSSWRAFASLLLALLLLLFIGLTTLVLPPKSVMDMAMSSPSTLSPLLPGCEATAPRDSLALPCPFGWLIDAAAAVVKVLPVAVAAAVVNVLPGAVDDEADDKPTRGVKKAGSAKASHPGWVTPSGCCCGGVDARASPERASSSGALKCAGVPAALMRTRDEPLPLPLSVAALNCVHGGELEQPTHGLLLLPPPILTPPPTLTPPPPLTPTEAAASQLSAGADRDVHAPEEDSAADAARRAPWPRMGRTMWLLPPVDCCNNSSCSSFCCSFSSAHSRCSCCFRRSCSAASTTASFRRIWTSS